MLESQAKPASTPPAPPPLTDTSNLHPCSTGVKCSVQDGYVHLGSSPCATWTCGDNQCTAYTSLPAPSASPLLVSWTARLATNCSGRTGGPQRGLPCRSGRPPPPGAGRPTTGQPGALPGLLSSGTCERLACGGVLWASCPVGLVGGGGTADGRRRPGHRVEEVYGRAGVDGGAGVDGRCGWHGRTPMGPWG
jgi:hypothetical protein